jgi:hypothetical protein
VSEDSKTLRVDCLTTYNVDPEGVQVDINARDAGGVPVTMVMPIASLTQLLMTLPKILEEALQVRSGDEAKRVVYSLEHWRMERGARGQGGEQLYILTVGTDAGFKVSFAAPADVLVDIARSIFGGIGHEEPVEEPRPRLS